MSNIYMKDLNGINIIICNRDGELNISCNTINEINNLLSKISKEKNEDESMKNNIEFSSIEVDKIFSKEFREDFNNGFIDSIALSMNGWEYYGIRVYAIVKKGNSVTINDYTIISDYKEEELKEVILKLKIPVLFYAHSPLANLLPGYSVCHDSEYVVGFNLDTINAAFSHNYFSIKSIKSLKYIISTYKSFLK